MIMLLGILLGTAVLIAYSKFEKRINQLACPECGYNISIDAIEEQCPRCDSILSEETEDAIELASRSRR